MRIWRGANALTVDVEEYFHVSAFSSVIPRANWGQLESRVQANTEQVLDLLASHEARGTFFVLGWVAQRHPKLIQQIQARGHEVACHSWEHRLVYQMTPEEFREDTRRAKDTLEQITGRAVEGYRAPSFSITADSLWALEIVAALGFKYDCSLAPVRHDIYGFPDASPVIHWQETPSGRILEFPISTIQLSGVRVPVAGGGYLRSFPFRATLWAMKKIHEKQGQPVMVYFHPWELDPEQPRVVAPLRARIRHYIGLNGTRKKLEALLKRFPFAPVKEVLAEVSGLPIPQRFREDRTPQPCLSR